MSKYLIILCLVLNVSCSQNKGEKIPEGIIPFDTMSNIMLDVQLMESHLNSERMYDPYIADSTLAFYNAVYKKHNVLKEDYDSSLMYYSKHILLMDSLYNSVFAKLQEKEIELQDVSYEIENFQYYTKQELVEQLNKLSIKKYLIREDVSFIHAKDSLNKFIINNEKEFDSLGIPVVKLKNSFNIYSNSMKRMKDLQEELRKAN
jgi:hypothetical protein